MQPIPDHVYVLKLDSMIIDKIGPGGNTYATIFRGDKCKFLFQNDGIGTFNVEGFGEVEIDMVHFDEETFEKF